MLQLLEVKHDSEVIVLEFLEVKHDSVVIVFEFLKVEHDSEAIMLEQQLLEHKDGRPHFVITIVRKTIRCGPVAHYFI